MDYEKKLLAVTIQDVKRVLTDIIRKPFNLTVVDSNGILDKAFIKQTNQKYKQMFGSELFKEQNHKEDWLKSVWSNSYGGK